MSESKELYAALAKARAMITGVERDGRNTQQGYNYASAEAMMQVAGPALSSNGLSIVPINQKPDFTEMMMHIEYLLCHESGQSVTLTSSTPMVITKFRSGAETPPDKAVGAAKTYDLRYLLRGVLGIPQVEKDADIDQREDGETKHAPRGRNSNGRDQRAAEQTTPPPKISAEEQEINDKLGAFFNLFQKVKYWEIVGKRPESIEEKRAAVARLERAQAVHTGAIANDKTQDEAASASERRSDPPPVDGSPPEQAPPPSGATSPPLRVVPKADEAQQPRPDANRDSEAAQKTAANGANGSTTKPAPAKGRLVDVSITEFWKRVKRTGRNDVQAITPEIDKLFGITAPAHLRPSMRTAYVLLVEEQAETRRANWIEDALNDIAQHFEKDSKEMSEEEWSAYASMIAGASLAEGAQR